MNQPTQRPMVLRQVDLDDADALQAAEIEYWQGIGSERRLRAATALAREVSRRRHGDPEPRLDRAAIGTRKL